MQIPLKKIRNKGRKVGEQSKICEVSTIFQWQPVFGIHRKKALAEVLRRSGEGSSEYFVHHMRFCRINL